MAEDFEYWYKARVVSIYDGSTINGVLPCFGSNPVSFINYNMIII